MSFSKTNEQAFEWQIEKALQQIHAYLFGGLYD